CACAASPIARLVRGVGRWQARRRTRVAAPQGQPAREAARARRASQHASGARPSTSVAGLRRFVGVAEPAPYALPGPASARARATLIRLLGRVAALERARGSFDRAIEALQRAVGIEPLNEEAQGALLELLGLAGRRHQAIAHYERLCAMYKRELNTTPDRRT